MSVLTHTPLNFDLLDRQGLANTPENYPIEKLSAEDKAEREFMIGQHARVDMIYKRYGKGVKNLKQREVELAKVKQDSIKFYKEAYNV